jgi:hypothetical protein
MILSSFSHTRTKLERPFLLEGGKFLYTEMKDRISVHRKTFGNSRLEGKSFKPPRLEASDSVEEELPCKNAS